MANLCTLHNCAARLCCGFSGVKSAASCVASNVVQYSTAAAGLVVVAAFWSVLHPPSYHLLRCIAAAMPIYAGYAETARACATNRRPEGAKVVGHLTALPELCLQTSLAQQAPLSASQRNGTPEETQVIDCLVPGGPPVLTLGGDAQAEAAWRSRHKWAAQHLAHLLGDAHAKPPLAPVLDLVERVSVNIGLAVNGAGVGSFATPAQGMGSGSNVWAWAAPREGCSLQLGGSIIAHKPDLAVLEAATASKAVR